MKNQNLLHWNILLWSFVSQNSFAVYSTDQFMFYVHFMAVWCSCSKQCLVFYVDISDFGPFCAVVIVCAECYYCAAVVLCGFQNFIVCIIWVLGFQCCFASLECCLAISQIWHKNQVMNDVQTSSLVLYRNLFEAISWFNTNVWFAKGLGGLTSPLEDNSFWMGYSVSSLVSEKLNLFNMQMTVTWILRLEFVSVESAFPLRIQLFFAIITCHFLCCPILATSNK